MTNGLKLQVLLQLSGLGAIIAGTVAPLTDYECVRDLRAPLWIIGWMLMAFVGGVIYGRMRADWLNSKI